MSVMNNNITSIFLLSIILSGLVYLITNIILQIKAKKNLEKLLSKKILQIEDIIISKYDPGLEGKAIDDAQYEKLLFILRKEIDSLDDNTDKLVLKKTLDRKNFSNQKRFAFKIFSESGLLERIFKGATFSKELVH